MQLVVFDLDGTISRHDTLVPYVIGFLRRRPRRLPRLVQVVPALIRFLLRRIDHGELKATLLQATLRGCRRDELAEWTGEFVTWLLEHGVFTEAIETVAEHRRRGDLLVLMSASPDLYVPAIAERLGFAETICTGVRWVGDRFDGALTTPNRRGDEKTRCFRELRQRYPQLPTVAYANGPSDFDHLRLADHGLLVNAPFWTRWKAARVGIPCAHWHHGPPLLRNHHTADTPGDGHP